jgi:RNA polymerase sigma-70 factor (ECF subfamily)
MAMEPWILDPPADRQADMHAAQVSDACLVRQMIDGSEDAFASLYERHSAAVFAAATGATRDRWIASDVVQETFLAMWNRADQFDPSRGTLPAWLARIARNRAIDRLRSAVRHERAITFSSYALPEADDHSVVEWLTASGELIGAASAEPIPEMAVSDKETRASIVDAVASLAPPERRVIMLAYDGGLSQSEIAASLGWPIGTVKTRTRRALRHLRDQLDAGVATGMTGPNRDAHGSTRTTHTKLPAFEFGECLAPC